MTIRMTNNSEIDPAAITKVERTAGGNYYRVEFADGSARQYRAVQLTTEGRQLLDSRLK